MADCFERHPANRAGDIRVDSGDPFIQAIHASGVAAPEESIQPRWLLADRTHFGGELAGDILMGEVIWKQKELMIKELMKI